MFMSRSFKIQASDLKIGLHWCRTNFNSSPNGHFRSFPYVLDSVEIQSHAHTVVWECCKDDHQSLFDPHPTLNPWTDRHQIWITWLRRGHLLPRKIRGQSAQGFLPLHTWNIHPKPSNVYFFFSQFFRKSTDALVGPFSRLIRHTTWFCARKYLLGVRKINFKIWPIYSKKSKNL